MKPPNNACLETLLRDAHRILDQMNDTPLDAMDASYYVHYAEELRLLVEDFAALHTPRPDASEGP